MEAADGLVAAVDRVFWDEASGSYRTSAHEYRQTPNLLAVGMGFVEPDRVDRVVASVVADLEARDRHHNVGHIGSRYLMPVLAEPRSRPAGPGRAASGRHSGVEAVARPGHT